jgi:hypothetical protein
MAYATEAHLFITDVNQSPFNVGTRLTLRDFTREEVAELNARYGTPLREDEVRRFHELVGGQPYLVQQGLQTIASGMTFADFEGEAARERGPYGDHLRRLVVLLSADGTLAHAVRTVLAGEPAMEDGIFYRLRGAGILAGDSVHDARLRCRLYADYLRRHIV